jgi:hypothetical protein
MHEYRKRWWESDKSRQCTVAIEERWRAGQGWARRRTYLLEAGDGVKALHVPPHLALVYLPAAEIFSGHHAASGHDAEELVEIGVWEVGGSEGERRRA